jgi:hypothetical protein
MLVIREQIIQTIDVWSIDCLNWQSPYGGSPEHKSLLLSLILCLLAIMAMLLIYFISDQFPRWLSRVSNCSWFVSFLVSLCVIQSVSPDLLTRRWH